VSRNLRIRYRVCHSQASYLLTFLERLSTDAARGLPQSPPSNQAQQYFKRIGSPRVAQAIRRAFNLHTLPKIPILKNQHSRFLPLGGIIQEFRVGGLNVVQGFPTQQDYVKHNTPFWCDIGRTSNRLKDAVITNLNGNRIRSPRTMDQTRCTEARWAGESKSLTARPQCIAMTRRRFFQIPEQGWR